MGTKNGEQPGVTPGNEKQTRPAKRPSAKIRVKNWLDEPVERRETLIGGLLFIGAAIEVFANPVGRATRLVESALTEGTTTEVKAQFQVVPAQVRRDELEKSLNRSMSADEKARVETEKAKQMATVKTYLEDGGRITVTDLREDKKYGFHAEKYGSTIEVLDDGFLSTFGQRDPELTSKRLELNSFLVLDREGTNVRDHLRAVNPSFIGFLAIPRVGIRERNLLTTGSFNPGTSKYLDDHSQWGLRAHLEFKDKGLRRQGWKDGEYSLIGNEYRANVTEVTKSQEVPVYSATSLQSTDSSLAVTYDRWFESFRYRTTYFDKFTIPRSRIS